MDFDLHKRYSRLLSGAGLMIDTRQHLPFFREIAAGDVLEIGVDVGNSTTAFLLGVCENGGHLYGIDINPKSAEVFKGHPQWTFLHGRSQSIDRIVLPLLDVLYVDGDHTYAGARHDIGWYGAIVKPGGLILVHDVEHPDFPGVRQAFDEYQAEKKYIRHGSWGLGVMEV